MAFWRKAFNVKPYNAWRIDAICKCLKPDTQKSYPTTLHSKMNAELSFVFYPYHENGVIKIIQTILYKCGLWVILVYPNPLEREANLKLTHRL